MREILFRGKRKDNEEWVYGDLWCNPYGKRVVCIVSPINNQGTTGGNEVDTETVGQYTGLKDKNGTKIFEGDILELINNDEDKSYYNVVWSTEDCRFKIREINLGEFFDDCDSWVHENMSVVGNIYDNPELLER